MNWIYSLEYCDKTFLLSFTSQEEKITSKILVKKQNTNINMAESIYFVIFMICK